jgi:hypothetical protein
MIARGVAIGATKPYQLSASTSGMPSSVVVGTEGKLAPNACKLARLNTAEQQRQIGKQHLHMSSQQIVHGRRSTRVGQVKELDLPP